MKSKRQTVWLVSMLSLMVLLSAYYLFTEDNPSKSPVAEGQKVTTMENGNTQETTSGDALPQNDEVILSEVVSENGTDVITNETSESDAGKSDQTGSTTEEGAKDSSKNSNKDSDKDSKKDSDVNSSTDNSAKATGEGTSNTAVKDEDVLKQLEYQGSSGADTLTAYQFQRSEQNMKKQDELLQAINDENKTLDEAVMAQKELSALEEKEEKIYDIEEKLQQTYSNAVVTESDNKYKVLVVSDKLEAKDAVGIMDLVIKELGVSQDKISVQYITQ
ncbi:stage III sporulation protein AH [Fontibacillus panacisegetis]|uniref:Stage III sporulation protein AH n=1 Tax=Fontibacillus panacisegetis TaxID=670482 RepID=A0A1G7R910_9BACL|nr:SpoIIIAH-like family protein [Fontibacillus panacisegetis]SDG07291.1 stage III sporulation protein AH [Fontibacillus panacisegetis]